MTQLLQFAPPIPAASEPGSRALAVLHETMDETIASLSVFDAARLETIQDQIGGLTAKFLSRELGENRDALPELLRKQTLLGEMLNATAANLRVVAAVLEAKSLANSTGTRTVNNDRSTPASWPR